MQKGLRSNEAQLSFLAVKAKVENSHSGQLFRRNIDSAKWQLKWFTVQHNLLFCYDTEGSQKVNSFILLEGCYAEEIILPVIKDHKQYGFAVFLQSSQTKQLELRAESDLDMHQWIDSINTARYSKLQEDKEQLEQKHLHMLHILEAETQAKWQNIRQIEDLSDEVKKLKAELRKHKAEIYTKHKDEETTEIRKIKKSDPHMDEKPITEEMIAKVQSFFRGWLCRRRWKQIVELYIKSPHAESMRTRNSVVFGMVEDEEDYVRNLTTLVTCFLRPLRMAASSKKPLISHDDVNSIFLNSETVLFLHQIFLKGLTARMDNWPTLVIGDLFDMLLPMLGIYQEYVRNHHYSLQVLAEYKQKPEFNHLLKRFEEKPTCENRVLETFLTYPMHQIPKYILALHELLAHTPYDHVERKKLEYAKSKLEELSMVMHDEVSETENIRKNLAIERMIIEGCDILLDTSQVFVRQGMLLQVGNDKSKYGGLRLANFSSTFKEKEVPRKVFLFTHHLLIATRLSNGRLHLAKSYGKIPLEQCMLIEDTSSTEMQLYEDEANSSSGGENGNQKQFSSASTSHNNTDFRIIVQPKEKEMSSISLTFVASSLQEKSAWCSDISQCMENLHYSDILSDSTTSNRLPQSVRIDPKTFKDDQSVKYCRTVKNSCKIPQIRHATVDKLLERLTDLRFLSIDFLNTFLLTYKVFTNSTTIMESLRRTVKKSCVTRETETCSSAGSSGEDQESGNSSPTSTNGQNQQDLILEEMVKESDSVDALNNVTSTSAYVIEKKRPGQKLSPVELNHTNTHKKDNNKTSTFSASERNGPTTNQLLADTIKNEIYESPSAGINTGQDLLVVSVVAEKTEPSLQCNNLHLPDDERQLWRDKRIDNRDRASRTSSLLSDPGSQVSCTSSVYNAEQSDLSEDTDVFESEKQYNNSINCQTLFQHSKSLTSVTANCGSKSHESDVMTTSVPLSVQVQGGVAKSHACKSPTSTRSMSPTLSHLSSSRSLLSGCKHNMDSSSHGVGGVITSSRVSRRRSYTVRGLSSPRRCSSSAATTAFAVATAGASTVKYNRHSTVGAVGLSANYGNARASSTFTAIMRALNVIKHWVSKYPQDFRQDPSLAGDVRTLLEDLMVNACLVQSEQKLAFNILKSLNKELEEQAATSRNLDDLLSTPAPELLLPTLNFDTIAALDIAEQITYLDHQIFMSITGEELLGLAWMKRNKQEKSPNVIQASHRFNEVSQLVVTEIVTRSNLQERMACIEKWAAIADILACTHNFNGVLQICAAFVNSSIYRLSKTWDRLTKQVKQIISKLQNLVSSEGKFKNMREALHKCDTACIPYLGMYLSDLSFIEEGSPNFVEEGLVNYSKMRMISNVIREIQEFQQQTYSIQHKGSVCAYLLDRGRLLSDEETYTQSLIIEPRLSKAGNIPSNQEKASQPTT